MVSIIGYTLHFGYSEIMGMRSDKAKKYYQQSVEILEAKNKHS